MREPAIPALLLEPLHMLESGWANSALRHPLHPLQILESGWPNRYHDVADDIAIRQTSQG